MTKRAFLRPWSRYASATMVQVCFLDHGLGMLPRPWSRCVSSTMVYVCSLDYGLGKFLRPWSSLSGFVYWKACKVFEGMRIAYAACSCQEAIVKQLAQQGPAKAAGPGPTSLPVWLWLARPSLARQPISKARPPCQANQVNGRQLSIGVLARSSLIYVPTILYGFWR